MTQVTYEEPLQRMAAEERDLLDGVECLQTLRPQECWAGRLVVHRTTKTAPTLGNFPADARCDAANGNIDVLYDAMTVEGLILHYTQGDEQVQDLVQRAYVGAGLARMLFITQGAAMAPKRKLGKFMEVMSDQDKLAGRLYEVLSLQPGEGVLRKLINDADSASQLNGLRLCLGIWQVAHGEDEYARALETVFTNSLADRLASKPQYVRFAKMFKVDDTGAEDTFSEYISDIQIAGACPMRTDLFEQAISLLT